MIDINLLTLISYLLLAVFACSFIYISLAIFLVQRHKKNQHIELDSADFTPAVTLLKPLCGLDADMLANLRTFCQQDYPDFQIVFGVQDCQDPAIDVVTALKKEYPELDLELVIEPRLYGSNHKVSNLINMMAKAKYDILIISDSDMRVEKDYIQRVTSAFSDDDIGAVTCLYSGTSTGKTASSLNAMFINEWFLPSVLISDKIQETKFCLGATMAVRRSIVEAMGGFKALKDHLADDYMLGKYVTDQGYKIHLCPMTVENVVEEEGMKSLIGHEIRWARTLRTVEPLSYFFTFITDTLVMSILAALAWFLASGTWLIPVSLVMMAFMARIFLHLSVKSALGSRQVGNIRLIPLRDFLSFAIRIGSFLGNSIEWRNHRFSVDQVGLIHAGTAVEPPGKMGDEEITSNLATNQEY